MKPVHATLPIVLSLLILGLRPSSGAEPIPRGEPQFESQAKFLVHWVGAQQGDGDPAPNLAEMKQFMRAEREILTSNQLAADVAKSIGLQRLAPALEGEKPDPELAAAVIKRGLKVRIPEKNQMITVTYQHPKPELAKEVLEKLSEEYFRLRLAQHRAGEAPASALDLALRRVQELEAQVDRLRKDPTTAKADLKLSKQRLVAAGLELRKLEQNQKGGRPNPVSTPNITVIQQPSEPRKLSP